VCGLAVDWVRSCYESRWRLFRENPDILTRGRYYFADPATPFYNGEHNLGSANWRDGNWLHDDGLGEVPGTQQWNPGFPPSVFPIEKIVGSRECIQRGEPVSNIVALGSLIDGFIPDCVLLPDPLVADWERISAFDNCPLQRFYLFIISCLDSGENAKIVEAFDGLIEGEKTVTIRPVRPLVPPFVTVVTTAWTLIVTSGTQNTPQLALEALQGAQPGTNYGLGKTMPLWWNSSTVMHESSVADGALPTVPIMLVGYSWGGACMHLLSARYRHGNANREIKYLTFGSPKPGAADLVEIMRSTQGLSIANDADLVTVMPPDLATVAPIRVLFPWLIRAFWADWVRPPNQVRQNADGSIDANDPPLIDTFQLQAILEDAFAHREIDVSIGHRLPSYIARNQRRCPQCVWPLSDAICGLIYYWGPEFFGLALSKKRPVPAAGAMVLTDQSRTPVPAAGRLGVGGVAPPPPGGACANAPFVTTGIDYTYLTADDFVGHWVLALFAPGHWQCIYTTDASASANLLQWRRNCADSVQGSRDTSGTLDIITDGGVHIDVTCDPDVTFTLRFVFIS